MSKELFQASREWFSRPDDERYLTLESLHEATLTRADNSAVEILSHNELEAVGDLNGGRIMKIKAPGIDEPLDPTHWSFGQVCSRARVPASFARGGCHPAIVADAINYNLRFVTPTEDSQVMVARKPDGELILRCITGPEYGRIYDHRVVEAVMAINEDERWRVPGGSTYGLDAPVTKRSTTLYASDRDVFLFLVDPETPIEIPKPDGGTEVLHRGFMVWNSEVGKSSFGIRTFLYRHVCDNRIVWGAEHVRGLTIRHTSGGPDRFRREARPVLAKYATESAAQTISAVRKSMEIELGRTDEDVQKWLQKRQFNAAEAKGMIARAKEEEGEARTLWQIVQGGTAMARSIGHTDDRVTFERRASGLMKIAEERAA